MLSEQLSKILNKYTCLLVQLQYSFRGSLRTQRDYEKSIRENEDGFFLSLYKLVTEGQTLMRAHLESYFKRIRDQTQERWGGYSQMPPQLVVKMQCAQSNVVNSILSLMYHQAFELFPFEEAVFRKQLENELRQVKIFQKLSRSAYPCDQR